MASEFFGLNRGALDGVTMKVATGSSTQATDVEVRVDTGKGTTRKDVHIILLAILRYIEGQGGSLGAVNIPPL